MLQSNRLLRTGVRRCCSGLSSGGPGRLRQRPGRHGVPDQPVEPLGIIAGADGNLWFTEQQASKIGRITRPASSRSSRPPRPTAAPGQSSQVRTAISGLPKTRPSRIGRITTAGVITEFPIPTAGSFRRHHGRPGRQPLVHREYRCINKIARITTSGVVTEFAVPQAAQRHSGIASGPDGNLWFTYQCTCRISPSRIRTDHHGRRRHRRVFRRNGHVRLGRSITTGPDGNLWFTQSTGNRSAGSPRPASSPCSRLRAATRAHLAGPDGNCGSPKSVPPDRAHHYGRRRLPIFPFPLRSDLRDRGRPGRQRLVHRVRSQQDRPHHPGRRRHRVFHPRRSTATPTASRRPGRQSLVRRRRGQQDRAHHARPAPSPSSRSRPPAAAHRHRGRARTATSGSPRAAGNKIGRITPAGVITEFPIPTPGSVPVGHHGRPGRQPLVHRVRWQQDRPDHDGRRITEFPIPTAGSGPSASRPAPTATSGSPKSTATRSAGSRRPAPSPSSRSPRPTARPTASRPARTATSGSPSSTGNKIGRITHGRRRHRVPDPHGRQRALGHHGRPRRQPLVHRSRRQQDRPDHAGRRHHRVPDPHAGSILRHHGRPDGNLWFTEATATTIGRITTGADRSRERWRRPPDLVEGGNSNGQRRVRAG